ncbi:MAG: 3-oxoacyl-ACP reductase FabG [Victivallales bacterium]|nr:3-oxoacyl-ACP reductase FabG [Victivallales bacterium]
MGRFDGKVALVTGGTRGIGLAIVERLASEGANVALLGRSMEGAHTAANFIAEKYGVKALGLAGDVALSATADDAVAQCLKEFEKIDILVNNAGITRDNLLMRMREEEWDAVLQTNLKSVFNMCKAVVRPMMKAHYGRIVNISSVVGICGNAGQTNYAAAKAGIIGFSKSLAKEIASRNINVNVIAPGMVDTDMTAALPEATRLAFLQNVPLARIGQPQDIAAGVSFLASEDASYITGHVLEIDGGLCI